MLETPNIPNPKTAELEGDERRIFVHTFSAQKLRRIYKKFDHSRKDLVDSSIMQFKGREQLKGRQDLFEEEKSIRDR